VPSSGHPRPCLVAGDPPIFLRDDTGELYVCAIKDIYSGRIVGYSMDARMTASLTVAVLCNAIDFRAPARAIV
jgi:putative transposase